MIDPIAVDPQKSYSPAVQKLLEGLNPAQAEAVLWNEGPMLVLSGPGSGKTNVLTKRIARILEESADQKFRILGLTFTNKAADEMRSRVESLVPQYASRLFLGTFHSFCAEVLRQHGSHLGIQPNFNIYGSDPDRQAILQDALKHVENEGGEVDEADIKLLPVLSRLKSELVDPDDAPNHVESDALKTRITAIYKGYDQCLRNANGLDFESIIFYAVKLFQSFPVLARHVRQVYRYCCIDEFQDTSRSQYEFIQALAGGNSYHLFAVADEDQIIFQWNGASHERIEEFRRDFSPDEIYLLTNYRCPPAVVDLANNLIKHNTRRTQNKQALQAAKADALSTHKTIRLGKLSSEQAEVDTIAADIKKLHAQDPGSVAVLARGNWLLEKVRTALKRAGLKAFIARRRDDFTSAPFVWMQACLEQSNRRRDKRTLEILCATFKELTQQDIDPKNIIAAADATHEDYLRQWADSVLRTAADKSAQTAARNVAEYLVYSTNYRTFVDTTLDWFDSLAAEESALEERFPGYEEDHKAWDALYQEILSSLGRSTASLEAFLHELRLRSKSRPPDKNEVTLTTIHAAKGKEFDHVYVIGLAEDELPSYRAKQKGNQSPELEEERRNCYVAITRALQSLTLTWAESYRGHPKRPSRFLVEMGLLPANP